RVLVGNSRGLRHIALPYQRLRMLQEFRRPMEDHRIRGRWIMNEASGHRYPGVAMLLHWLLAIGVFAQWRIAVAAENAPTDEAGSEIMANHFSLGATLLVLALVRLVWR